ncbi:amino acid ABC transporter permease [Thermodesulfatator indicus]
MADAPLNKNKEHLIHLSSGIILSILMFFYFKHLNLKPVLTEDNIRFLLFGMPGEIGGLALTLLLTLILVPITLIFGAFLAILRSSKGILKWIASFYIEVVRATPLIMVIFWVYFAIPIFIKNVTNKDISVQPVIAALIAFSIFTSAYIAEILRSGLNSISKGTKEAALSLGLTKFQMYAYIIIPLVIKRMLPSLLAQYVAMFKDTSLAYIIGVIEFFRAATILNNRLFLSMEIFTIVAIVYFILSFIMSRLARKLEIRWRKQLSD